MSRLRRPYGAIRTAAAAVRQSLENSAVLCDVPGLALAAQFLELNLQRLKLGDAQAHLFDTLVQQSVHLAATLLRRVAKAQQAAHFVERHVERAAVPDELQATTTIEPGAAEVVFRIQKMDFPTEEKLIRVYSSTQTILAQVVVLLIILASFACNFRTQKEASLKYADLGDGCASFAFFSPALDKRGGRRQSDGPRPHFLAIVPSLMLPAFPLPCS